MFEHKSFREDLDIFFDKIEKEHISFTRFGDGEWTIIRKKYINLLNKDNGEFMYCPTEVAYAEPYRLLKKSLTHQAENYYVGLCCPCCAGSFEHVVMKKRSNQKIGHVTWANLFANSNYSHFLTKITEFLKDKSVFLISNEKSNVEKFPLKVEKHYRVGSNSWLRNLDLIETIKKDIVDSKIENSYFLFCAGPLSNIACCELFEFNNKNTYLDCGSVFDDLIGLGKTRGYLRGSDNLSKTCVWEND
jgi:hypothetical protein